MPYRRDASRSFEPAVVGPDGSLARLDVSGAGGRDGAPGVAGAHGSRSGAHGQHGGRAGPAEIGQSAGRVRVLLESHPSLGEERLVLTAELTLADGGARRVERDVAFREGGFLDLVARGGAGGRGGHGGTGGDGAPGSNGHDATQYSDGGNGGTGGNGGGGGDGTSGGSGGAGGRIEVHVAEADTHLVMLLRPDVQGGAGGSPGVNGPGGRAGAGGRGGSSYHWTETEHYTDSDGNQQTRTTHHSRSGGWNGSSGQAGSPGRAALHPGAAGPRGHFEIVVRHATGQLQRYADRYRVRLVSFEHVNANDDGIYEPGERVEVRRIRVANVGGMPTPSSHDVQLTLDSDGWVWPEPDTHLLVPRSLEPGVIAEVPGSLFFRIGDHTPEGPSDPLEAEDHIGQTAFLPSVNRSFRGYRPERDASARYVVRYPLELSVVETLPSVAPGEAARVRFAVRNVSRRAFGAGSSLARVIRLRLAVRESELAASHFTLYDEHDRPVDPTRGWVMEVDRLEPGEARTFEGTLAMSPGAPHFGAVTFWLALELGAIEAPHAPGPIQYRAFTTRVARRYVRPEHLDLLLVVHHGTSRDEVAAWEALSARLGLAMTTWDPALEGHLDPCRPLRAGALVDHLRRGTLVVLNPLVRTPAGDVRPHQLLDRARLRALVDAEIATVVLGGEVDLARWLVPDAATAPASEAASEPTCEPASEHPDGSRLLASLAAREREGAELRALHEAVAFHHIGFWFEPPSANRLRVRAERLSRALAHAHPHRRYVLLSEHAPEVASSLGIVKRWRMGRLRVRATLGSSRSHVVHASEALLTDPARLAEVLLLARSFDEKLTRLASAVRAERDASAEVRAILVDLASELRAVLASGWRRGLSRAALRRALPLLRQAVERARELGAPLPEAPEAAPLIELAARLRYYARAQPRAWEWPLWPARRATVLRHVTVGLVDRWIEAAFGVASSTHDVKDAASATRVTDARRRVQARERILGHEERLALAEQLDERLDRRAHAHYLLCHPLEWEGVTTDAELLGDPASRVLDEAALAALRAADTAEARLRERVGRAWRDARTALSRPVPT